MSVEISSIELTILHTSVERVAASITATISHFRREGVSELADLHQLAMEDIVRLRDIVGKAMSGPKLNVSDLALAAMARAVSSGNANLAALNTTPDTGAAA